MRPGAPKRDAKAGAGRTAGRHVCTARVSFAPDMDPAAIESFRSGPWDIPGTPSDNRPDAHVVSHGAHGKSFPPHMIRFAAKAFPEMPSDNRAEAHMVPHGAHGKSFPPHMIRFAAKALRHEANALPDGADVKQHGAHGVRRGLHQAGHGAHMLWHGGHQVRHGGL